MHAPRLTVRTRLAVTFTAVFLAAGGALIAFTISLASQSIDRANAANAPAERELQSTIRDILAAKSPTASTPSSGSASALASTPGSGSASPSANPSPKLSGKPNAVSSTDAGVKQKLLKANRTYSASTGSAAVNRMITWALVAAALLVPVAVLLGWLLAGRALRPVRAVSAAARRVSDTSLSERLNMVGPRDEITELATTFDAMMDRLQSAFEAQRRFVADASHELRTPLAVAGTAVDVVLAKSAPTSAQLEETALDVRAALTRAEEVVDSLLALTRSQHLERRHDLLDLAILAEDALDTQYNALTACNITLDARLEQARLVGDRPLLERLIGNLVDNAIRHNLPSGRIRVHTGIRDGQAELVIANTGALIPPEVVGSLFEPFTRLAGRARTADAGLGLGLAIARAVADAHHAELTAVALPEGGLQVTLRLPC